MEALRKIRLAATLLAFSLGLALFGGDASTSSSKGAELTAFYDSLPVETKWLSGAKVDWRSGDPLPGDKPGKTHCSAFAAAACERLGVYLLRPPEHPQNGLANAQYDWLLSKGAERGWRRLSSMEEAQKAASDGLLVVAVLKNPEPSKPGHIALVRPGAKRKAELEKDGPDVIQAGGTNYKSTTLKNGFRRHPGAFEAREILFFSHEIEKPPLKGP